MNHNPCLETCASQATNSLSCLSSLQSSLILSTKTPWNAVERGSRQHAQARLTGACDIFKSVNTHILPLDNSRDIVNTVGTSKEMLLSGSLVFPLIPRNVQPKRSGPIRLIKDGANSRQRSSTVGTPWLAFEIRGEEDDVEGPFLRWKRYR